MKKSMLTLVGCAVAASTVMAASVEGNNTAVVIQKDAVVSNTNYQFLIVPVKGFDITNGTTAKTISLAELFPTAAYEAGTYIYRASAPGIQYEVVAKGGDWKVRSSNPVELANDEPIGLGEILWMKTTGVKPEDVAPSVFCGEASTEAVSVTPVAGQFVAFGNATSEAVTYSSVTTAADGDLIYLVQEGSSDYYTLRYDANLGWTKPPATGTGLYEALGEGDLFPAGAAAYYFRASN